MPRHTLLSSPSRHTADTMWMAQPRSQVYMAVPSTPYDRRPWCAAYPAGYEPGRWNARTGAGNWSAVRAPRPVRMNDLEFRPSWSAGGRVLHPGRDRHPADPLAVGIPGGVAGLD